MINEIPSAVTVPTDSRGPDTGAWRAYLTVVLLNLTALGAITWHLRDPTKGALRIELPPTIPIPTLPAPAAPTQVRLVVHVAGAVSRPGVVSLSEGARVEDAVVAAGGFAESADQGRLNLAASVADGSMLWIPALGEVAPAHVAGVAAEPAGPPVPAAGAAPGQSGSGVVNINTATASELESLPGIGPSLAGRIIAFRDAQGPFASPEGILDVPGIGPRTLERFAELIRVH